MLYIKQLMIISLLMFSLIACNTSKSIDQNIEEILNDPDYMKGCFEINPQKSVEQVGFEGVVPGITNIDEVFKIYGNPKETNLESNYYEWYQFDNFSVTSKSKIVTEIFLDYDEETTKTLIDYIELYGCPNAIYQSKPGEEHPGSIRFIYNGIGFGMIFFTPEKVSFMDKPGVLLLFPPTSLREYIINDQFLSNPSFAQPIPWRKAIRK